MFVCSVEVSRIYESWKTFPALRPLYIFKVVMMKDTCGHEIKKSGQPTNGSVLPGIPETWQWTNYVTDLILLQPLERGGVATTIVTTQPIYV